MYYQSEYEQLAFDRFPKYSQQHANALHEYISSDVDLLDLPMQISNNPFARPRTHSENRPFYSKNNQSLSKCAVTEMSSKADEDYEESITPVCQKLFEHHTSSRVEKEFELQQTLPTEVITEATFKPNDLHEYFKESKARDGSKLKQILKENVFNQNRKEPKDAKSRVSSQMFSKTEQAKQKTKYERILEQYFNSKSKKETIKSRLSREKLPNYKIQYSEQAQANSTSTAKAQLLDNAYKIKSQAHSNPNPLLVRSKSEKQIPIKQKTSSNFQKKSLTKTFSQHLLKEKPKQYSKQEMKQMAEGWMMMSFEERQSRTLENRKSKQKMGHQANLQKQSKGCTFKPTINDFKPPRQLPCSGGSYAKLYYQKIRRRI